MSRQRIVYWTVMKQKSKESECLSAGLTNTPSTGSAKDTIAYGHLLS